MQEEKLSRRGFLTSAGKIAAGAAAGAVCLSMVIGSRAEAGVLQDCTPCHDEPHS